MKQCKPSHDTVHHMTTLLDDHHMMSAETELYAYTQNPERKSKDFFIFSA